jgi:hypothetical protein
MRIMFIFKNKILQLIINMVIWWFYRVCQLYKIAIFKIKFIINRLLVSNKDTDNKTVRIWGIQIILKLLIIKINKNKLLINQAYNYKIRVNANKELITRLYKMDRN